MRLLFLDTETTGVNFLEDQIIEIAGIVYEFDKNSLEFTEISRFESLVALRQELDEKITRITGISDIDLATAPKIQIAQENWANWLEGLNADVVIGHSIDFDLRFLKKESWFLPENIKPIDTLDLSKIFFPELSAINLEFLKEKLGLVQTNDFAGDKNLSHRALFDTHVCFLLFKTIIEKIKNTKLPGIFLDTLVQNFLPLEISFYSHDLEYSSAENQGNQRSDRQLVDINGQLVESSLYNRINQADPITALKVSVELLNTDLPSNLKLVLLQLYIIYDIKLRNPEYSLKLHSQGNIGFTLVEIFLEIVENQSKILSVGEKPKFVLSPLESIINQIRFVAESYYDIGKLVKNLELYLALKLHIQRLDESTVTVEKWLSSYDFLLISLNPFWKNNEFRYFQYLLNHQTKQVVTKYTNFCELTRDLKKNKLDNSNILFSTLNQKITKLLDTLDIYERSDSTFRLFNNYLTISKPKPEFDLRLHFEKLLTIFPELEIETNLSYDSFVELINMLELGDLFEQKQLNVTYLIEEIGIDNKTAVINEQIDLNEFFGDKLELAKTSKKPIIFLGGQNSTLKDAQKVLVENYNVSDYLVLGESGSLTKVGSKIERGFVGLVVTKVGDINFLLKQRNAIEFAEIWVVNQPYLWVHPFWVRSNMNKEQQEEFATRLKKFYLEQIINQTSILSKKQTGFIRSYKS